MRGGVFWPKGLSIYVARGYDPSEIRVGGPRYPYSVAIKGKGRTGARARAMFAALPREKQQRVLREWLDGGPADLGTA